MCIIHFSPQNKWKLAFYDLKLYFNNFKRYSNDLVNCRDNLKKPTFSKLSCSKDSSISACYEFWWFQSWISSKNSIFYIKNELKMDPSKITKKSSHMVKNCFLKPLGRWKNIFPWFYTIFEWYISSPENGLKIFRRLQLYSCMLRSFM